MTEIVLQTLTQGLLTITMNRPDQRNALNPEMVGGSIAAAAFVEKRKPALQGH
jgi:2-(1,2-epoxy-1,2-dihydrophenyl)acetyl-CoA isomerase